MRSQRLMCARDFLELFGVRFVLVPVNVKRIDE